MLAHVEIVERIRHHVLHLDHLVGSHFEALEVQNENRWALLDVIDFLGRLVLLADSAVDIKGVALAVQFNAVSQWHWFLQFVVHAAD